MRYIGFVNLIQSALIPSFGPPWSLSQINSLTEKGVIFRITLFSVIIFYTFCKDRNCFGLRSPTKNLPMNLRASHPVSLLRIVLYVGKLYNFAYVAIALNYANLSRFFPKMPGFVIFLCRNYLHFQTIGRGTRGLNLGKERNHENKITCNNGML
jgi:hypothetical protein